MWTTGAGTGRDGLVVIVLDLFVFVQDERWP